MSKLGLKKNESQLAMAMAKGWEVVNVYVDKVGDEV